MGSNRMRAKAVLLLALIVWASAPLAHAQDQTSEFVTSRVTMWELSEGEPVTVSIQTDGQQRSLVAWSCQQCTLEANGEHITSIAYSAKTMVVEAHQATTFSLLMTSSVSEVVTVMVVEALDEEQPTVRPAPSETASTIDAGRCTNLSDCIDTDTGTVAARIPSSTDADFLVSGYLNSSSDEFIVIDIQEGETIEWQWLAATNDVTVQLYHQTTTEEELIGSIHTIHEAFSELDGLPPRSMWWTAHEDGRFVARVGSNNTEVAWAAHVITYPALEQQSLVGQDLHYGAELVGHDSLTAVIDWRDTDRLHLHARLGGLELRVDQFFEGSWVDGEPFSLGKGDSSTIYPYPGTTAGQLRVLNTPAFALEILADSFADQDSMEAPSYRPVDLEVNNSTWPLLNLTSSTSGEFTLSVHDTVDTYRIVVDGWEDSIHFVQFSLDGNVEGLELQLWDIDQVTGEVLGTDITRPVGDELSIGLQVGRGTHYFQIRFQNASEVTSHLWGEDVNTHNYVVQASYTLIDEGEEPWYPPSDDAVFWGTFARWFLGMLFLVPAVYLGISLRRSRAYAEEVANMKQRLAWYAKRLDSGESDVKAARLDMAKALQAVAQLDWQEGLDAWGEQRIEHRTEHLAMAVWKVDERLAKQDGAWPLVVGIHVLHGAWELAALRFDAPSGAGFEVVHAEPRFLFQGEEVFLDAMNEGHRVYVLVELQGEALTVDVELNGRMDNVPFAARVPVTVARKD